MWLQELEEVERVAEEIGVAKVQLSTLYKAFKRHTADSELFTSEEWGHILSLIGVSRSDVRQRMFEVNVPVFYSNDHTSRCGPLKLADQSNISSSRMLSRHCVP